jgi:hypothetical protein
MAPPTSPNRPHAFKLKAFRTGIDRITAAREQKNHHMESYIRAANDRYNTREEAKMWKVEKGRSEEAWRKVKEEHVLEFGEVSEQELMDLVEHEESGEREGIEDEPFVIGVDMVGLGQESEEEEGGPEADAPGIEETPIVTDNDTSYIDELYSNAFMLDDTPAALPSFEREVPAQSTSAVTLNDTITPPFGACLKAMTDWMEGKCQGPEGRTGRDGPDGEWMEFSSDVFALAKGLMEWDAVKRARWAEEDRQGQ